MTDDMLHVMAWHNGEKDYSPFSDAEMKRRQNDVRRWMAENSVDAALFTSYHCINYCRAPARHGGQADRHVKDMDKEE